MTAQQTRAAAITVGTYLTDGKRLAYVRRVGTDGIAIEEGDVEKPNIDFLKHDEVLKNWRVVELGDG